MLDKKDIQKMIEIFTTKEDLESFVTKDEFREAISGLHTAIDAYAKKADAYFQEMLMLAHKVDRLEKWVCEMAKKIGMKLEY